MNGSFGNGFAGGGRRGAMMGHGPQGPTQPGQGMGQKTFPQNKDDVMKFILDLKRAMYSEQQQAEIVKILGQTQNIGQAIGQLAGSLVMTMIQRRAQQQGVKPHIKLAIMGSKMVIEELAEMAQMMGKEVSENDLKEAANVSGAIIEHAGGVKPNQPGPQTSLRAGSPGGMPQGPPQPQGMQGQGSQGMQGPQGPQRMVG